MTLAAICANMLVLAARGLLREPACVRCLPGQRVETARKSIALGLILQDTSRTLTDEEADAIVAAVIDRAEA